MIQETTKGAQAIVRAAAELAKLASELQSKDGALKVDKQKQKTVSNRQGRAV